MGFHIGGIILAGILNETRKEIEEYLGQINQIRAGIKIQPEDVLEKPSILILLEQMEHFNTLILDGGLWDQPHITILQLGVAKYWRDLYAQISNSSSGVSDGSRK